MVVFLGCVVIFINTARRQNKTDDTKPTTYYPWRDHARVHDGVLQGF